VDEATVGHDLGLAGDGGPFAGVVEEAEVDVGVGLEVVGLAGLRVGVEDEVDAITLLWLSQLMILWGCVLRQYH